MEVQPNRLTWSKDYRSIGYYDPDEGYVPVIGWNFDLVNYVSHPNDRYCAYIAKIRPVGTDSIFQVIWKPEWTNNFKKVLAANREYSHGVILRNQHVDEKLWSEMMDRYIFEHPNIPCVRPAENVGLQVRFLIDNAFQNNDCISLEDVESVYQDVVYNGLGEVKSNPIHTIVEEARPKVSLFFPYCDKTIILHIF